MPLSYVMNVILIKENVLYILHYEILIVIHVIVLIEPKTPVLYLIVNMNIYYSMQIKFYSIT